MRGTLKVDAWVDDVSYTTSVGMMLYQPLPFDVDSTLGMARMFDRSVSFIELFFIYRSFIADLGLQYV